jgi:FRG domain
MLVSKTSKIADDEFKMAFLFCKISNHFESLGKCIHYLRDLYGQTAVNQDLPPKTDKPMPSFLFRGESGIFDTTYSCRTRIDIDFFGRMHREQKKFTDLIQYCTQRSALTIHGFSPDERVAFLQHYGLPTYALDTTSDLDTAAYFGSFGDPQRVKLIAVINTDKLVKWNVLPVDLSSGRFGSRPSKQHTYSIFLGGRENLKSPLMTGIFDVKWYSYVLTESDKHIYNTSRGYLSEGDKNFMSLLPQFIREYESAHGKIHPQIKQYWAAIS